MWQNMPSRSLGSNHVLLGGMMPPPSAMAIKSSMLVGNIEKAQAYSLVLTSFSNSAVPRMPPTKLMRLLVRWSLDAKDRRQHVLLQQAHVQAFERACARLSDSCGNAAGAIGLPDRVPS